MILTALIIIHLIADFYFQSTNCAQKKVKEFKYFVIHIVLYTLVTIVGLLLIVEPNRIIKPALFLSIIHLIIDFIKIRINKIKSSSSFHFLTFVIDQLLHVFSILFVFYSFRLREFPSVIAIRLVDFFTVDVCRTWLRYGLLFILLLDPASVFVKLLSACASNETNLIEQKGDASVGQIIGKLERIIIAVLVLCNQIGTIGFVLTAKSLARYKQLENREFAEKYLVGTLSSITIAIVATLLLK